MFNIYHVNYGAANAFAEAVKGGFAAWGLLIASMGIIFVSVLVINKIAEKISKKDK